MAERPFAPSNPLFSGNRPLGFGSVDSQYLQWLDVCVIIINVASISSTIISATVVMIFRGSALNPLS